MLHSAAEMAALQAETGATSDLEAMVGMVELRLGALSESLRERDVLAVEAQANELHRALARAVESFMYVARHGGVPEPMRTRLARASAQVARQREALARATAALDRAIDVLMPGSQGSHQQVYSASGRTEALSGRNSLHV
jgi:hypothetical protein